MAQEKRKRSKRKVQECPYCHKSYGNVKNHILMYHQAEVKKAPVSLTKDDLLGKGKPPADPPAAPPGEQPPQLAGLASYHCNNCSAALRKGENPCHQCGERLIWDGID